MKMMVLNRKQVNDKVLKALNASVTIVKSDTIIVLFKQELIIRKSKHMLEALEEIATGIDSKTGKRFDNFVLKFSDIRPNR